MNMKQMRPDDVFAKAFEDSCKFFETKEKLADTTDELQRSQYEKTILRLENKITPAAKRAAIKRNRRLTTLVWRCLRRYGVPENIGHFIAKLSAKRVLTVTGKAGRPRTLTERGARDILRKKFGVEGKPGRKPE